MKLSAPAYYKDFKCIADKCTHSCCIGWEIDVDGATLEKYESLCGGYGEEIKKSIETGDCPHFRLCEGDRCPHLDERGLCRIISLLSEDYLCNICREHPRFYNFTKSGAEAGLGLSCEEAARIILSSDGFLEMTEIGELCDDEEVTFDGTDLRQRIYSVLCNGELCYDERLSQIYEAFGVSPFEKSEEEWRAVFSSLEYLEDAHRELFCSLELKKETPKELEDALKRALAYFVYRHVTAASDGEDGICALGLALLLERLLCFLASRYTEIGIVTLARIISEELEYSVDNTFALKDEFFRYEL